MSNDTQPPSERGDAAQTTTLLEPPHPIALVHAAFQERLQLHDTEPIDVMLATVVSVTEDDVPLWIMMVAPPSSGKTEMLLALNGIKNPNVYLLSKLTPQTLVSGWQASDPRQQSSLLKRIPDKSVLLLKDFTTILRTRAEERAQILAQLREIYDGALDSSYGTGADVKWRGKLGILAAVTDVIDQFSPYEQMLGERFLKVRIEPAPRQAVALQALQNSSLENEMKQALREAVAGFLTGQRRPAADVTFSHQRQEQVAALADFVALARTTPHRDARSREIDVLVEAEGPARLARQFGLLARSVAAVRDHTEVLEADIATTCRVGFDSLTPLRRRVLGTFRRPDGGAGMTTTQLSERLRLSWSATNHHLEDARAVNGGLMECVGKDGWVLSDTARQLLGVLQPYHP